VTAEQREAERRATVDQIAADVVAVVEHCYAAERAGRRLTGRLWHDARRAEARARGLELWRQKLERAGR
jgi:hypothetical protein